MITLLPLEGLQLFAPFVAVSTWFGAGLVDPLRAGLAVATAVPLASLLASRVSTLPVAAAGATLLAAGVVSTFAWEAATAIKDDRRVVVDEVAGYVGAVIAIRLSGYRVSLGGLSLLAVLFLAVDRLKPWPMQPIERLPGGFGVMLDDVAAGVVTGLVAALACAVLRHGRGR
ncbi:phosphatidylglycerophosphatase A family protein [Pararhizobium haloflavum]|uniref:phosphatidylglycerophosphatase A family protein n=1 Tax=Pararhizobium haloflavum TaxID=2037914 RepID=UPI000C189763|nr:phosphatidylglycerophosphatase A [Pararhizobium haloflavum]